jgi:hypothetical protein
MGSILVHAEDDYDESNTFEAFHIPAERWNGAAKPFFSSIEASRIAEDCAKNFPFQQQFRWNGQLDGGNGGFEYDINDDGPEEWHAVPTMEIDGVTYYQMGDGWTWQEIELPTDLDPENEWDMERKADYAELRESVSRQMHEHANIQTTDLHYARVNTQEA